jgi:hypothetical protein
MKNHLAYSIVFCIVVISLSFYGGYLYGKKKETFMVRKNSTITVEDRVSFMGDLIMIDYALGNMTFCPQHTSTSNIKEVNKIIVNYMTAAIGNKEEYPVSLYTKSDYQSILKTATANLRTLLDYYRYGGGGDYKAKSFDYGRIMDLLSHKC